MERVPSYRELPPAEGGGRSAWGLFGPDDSVGLLNLQTPEAVARAAHAVRTGEVFPLDIPSDFLTPQLFERGVPRLTQIERYPRSAFDDVRDNVYSQGGSQWDALAHIAYADDRFYNGATADDIRTGRRNTIEHWARRGIAGRAVVLDLAPIIAERGAPGESIPITVDDLERARLAAGVDYQVGDVLAVHTGFLEWYGEQSAAVRTRISFRDRITAAGLEHSEDIAEYLWDAHVSAYVSDTAGVEVMPADTRDESRPFGYLHRVLIGQFGMALGELWWLSDLVRACHADGRYDCLLVSAPQNVPRAVGSPANGIAIR